MSSSAVRQLPASRWDEVRRYAAGKTIEATTRLHRGRLNEGQKEAVRVALSSRDRVIGIQGYAGTGKTTMLKRFRDLSARNGYTLKGLARPHPQPKRCARKPVFRPRPCSDSWPGRPG